jgi:DNA polymerase-3 subunit delta
VVLIKNAEKFVSENRPLLEKYFENPSPTGILILAVSKWDSRTRLAKSLPGVGELISVTGPTGGNLLRNIKEYCQRVNGKVLEDEAADVLVEWAGDDLPRLYGEIEKLGVYVGDENRIRAGAVESLVGHNRTYNAFAVIDSCVAGDAGQAVEQLRVMFAEDKSTEYSVVGAFAFHVRRLFNGKVLLEQGLEPWMIAKKMGVWHNESGFFSQIRSMSLVRIGHLLEELADMDYAIKTGRTTAQSAVERLVIRLATDSAKGAGEDWMSSHR